MEEAEFQEYFEQRAAEERAAAERATDERAAQMHRKLAKEYARRAKEDAGITEDEDPPIRGILPKEFRILP